MQLWRSWRPPLVASSIVGTRRYASGALNKRRLEKSPRAPPYAEVVDDDNSTVPIVTLEDLSVFDSEPVVDVNDGTYISSRESRFHPDTLAGKSTGDELLILPEAIATVISNSTVGYYPDRLRANAMKYYRSLADSGAHRPATESLDVETHLTGVFLQNYASLHNVLTEARKRLGVSSWRPQRILDVGFGPATGMVALNEVFADAEDWDPERKLAIVIGHQKMKKRAESLLATQLKEAVAGEASDLELVQSDSEAVDDITAHESDAVEETAQSESGVTEETQGDSEVFGEITSQSVSSEAVEEMTAQSEPDANEAVEAFEPEEGTEENIQETSSQSSRPIKTLVRQNLPPHGSSAKYDLIIATHQLYRSGFHYPASVDDHTSHLLSLLAPDGVLVLLERGDPTGFESVARARQIMFRPESNPQDVTREPRAWKDQDDFKLQIVAPCTHHGKCPLQVELGRRNKGKNPAYFNWCKFAQMVQRPKFALELKKGQLLSQEWTAQEDGTVRGSGGKVLSGTGRPFGRSFETATHSYLIVQREGESKSAAEGEETWARILRPPMKRDKHVIMEVCAPSSHVEQWTVTRGSGKGAYYDARKATGGDVWALGAKVVQRRGGNIHKMKKLSKKLENKTADEGSAEGSNAGDSSIDTAWSKTGDKKGVKAKRRNPSRGSEPSAYGDVIGGLDEYFEELAEEKFGTKKFRDSEKTRKKQPQW